MTTRFADSDHSPSPAPVAVQAVRVVRRTALVACELAAIPLCATLFALLTAIDVLRETPDALPAEPRTERRRGFVALRFVGAIAVAAFAGAVAGVLEPGIAAPVAVIAALTVLAATGEVRR